VSIVVQRRNGIDARRVGRGPHNETPISRVRCITDANMTFQPDAGQQEPECLARGELRL